MRTATLTCTALALVFASAFVGGATTARAQASPLPEGFEDGIPSDWLVTDNGNGNAERWRGVNDSTYGNIARSEYEFVNEGVAIDALVTPLLIVDDSTRFLLFDAAQSFAAVFTSVYEIRVSSESRTDPADYTTIATFTETDFPFAEFEGPLGTFGVDLSAYVGDSVYVAFVHTNNDGDNWLLDNVRQAAEFATAPVASVDPTSLTFELEEGDRQSQDVTLSNTAAAGADSLDYTITVEQIAPLQPTPPAAGQRPGPVGAHGLFRADGGTDAAPPSRAAVGRRTRFHAGGGVSITHNNSTAIEPATGIACGNQDAGYTTENSFWRVFDLAEFGITGPLDVTSVDLGIEQADLPTGALPSRVRFYTLDGAFLTSNLTLIGTADYTIQEADDLALVNVPVSGITFEPSDVMVVEWNYDDGEPTLSSVFPGANNDGASDDTYISAEACGITEPATYASIGFPNNHWVLVVNGVSEAGAPVTVSPESGMIAAGDEDIITVTVDAAELAVGSYDYQLLIATNDPVNDTLTVDIDIAVRVDAEDGGVPAAFALGQNQPNPVTERTRIQYALPEATAVRIDVYDVAGRHVATLASGEQAAGRHEVEWDARGVASGLYVYRIVAGDRVEMRRMTVTR